MFHHNTVRPPDANPLPLQTSGNARTFFGVDSRRRHEVCSQVCCVSWHDRRGDRLRRRRHPVRRGGLPGAGLLPFFAFLAGAIAALLAAFALTAGLLGAAYGVDLAWMSLAAAAATASYLVGPRPAPPASAVRIQPEFSVADDVRQFVCSSVLRAATTCAQVDHEHQKHGRGTRPRSRSPRWRTRRALRQTST